MSSTELLLIDLSAIAHQIWHVSGSEPDPSFVSNQIIARVRQLASQHPHAAICCDSGKSFRKDLDPTYKANRDTENRAPLRHQMAVACEALAKDGFPVWAVAGYEADDIIATATREALAIDPDVTVLIASADKDLLQLVNDRVTMKKITDGNVVDEAAVVAKFGVRPSQMLDFLSLVGDVSDNIVGAKGIGGVIASTLLKAHGSIEAVYDAMAKGVVKELTPARRTAMQEFRERWPLVKSLIALKTDAPIPFAEIAVERTAAAMVEEPDMASDAGTEDEIVEAVERDRELSPAQTTDALKDATAKVAERIAASPDRPMVNVTPQDVSARGAEYRSVQRLVSQSESIDFTQQLEPRNMPEAVTLAQRMFESRLFSAYGTPQAVLSTILAGRELGIPAMASLRAFHIIEGKPQLSAGTIQSLVLKSGKASYFRCTERTSERATFVTKRGDDPEMALTYTIEEGRAAWPKDDAAWKKSGWGRNPADMLVARAGSKLARLVYPDVVAGLYAPEEMD